MTEARHVAAFAMTSGCMNFLYLHETIHIRNGHLRLKQSLGSEPQLSVFEDEAQPEKLLNALDFRTLEWDADKVAFLNGMEPAIAYSQQLFSNMIAANVSRELANKVYLFGLYFMFR